MEAEHPFKISNRHVSLRGWNASSHYLQYSLYAWIIRVGIKFRIVFGTIIESPDDNLILFSPNGISVVICGERIYWMKCATWFSV